MLSFASTRQPVHRKFMKFRKVLMLKLSWKGSDFWGIFWVQTGLKAFWKLLSFRSSLQRSHSRERGGSSQNLQESLIRTDVIIASDFSHLIYRHTVKVYPERLSKTCDQCCLNYCTSYCCDSWLFIHLSVYFSVCIQNVLYRYVSFVSDTLVCLSEVQAY